MGSERMTDTKQSIEDMKKQIEEIKAQTELQKQINELKALQQQVAPQVKANDPMQRLMKLAMPVGGVILILGLAVMMLFHNFTMGLFLAAVAAIPIGIKIGLEPRKPQDPAKPAGQQNIIGKILGG